MNPFKVNQWIQWTTEGHVKRGQVVVSKGPSIVVEWLGGERQVFPIVEQYVGRSRRSNHRMDVIQRPKEASRIKREERKGVMSVSRAAATLGITPKRVRAMLRAGQLEGTQKEGKWTSVNL